MNTGLEFGLGWLRNSYYKVMIKWPLKLKAQVTPTPPDILIRNHAGGQTIHNPRFRPIETYWFLIYLSIKKDQRSDMKSIQGQLHRYACVKSQRATWIQINSSDPLLKMLRKTSMLLLILFVDTSGIPVLVPYLFVCWLNSWNGNVPSGFLPISFFCFTS